MTGFCVLNSNCCRNSAEFLTCKKRSDGGREAELSALFSKNWMAGRGLRLEIGGRCKRPSCAQFLHGFLIFHLAACPGASPQAAGG